MVKFRDISFKNKILLYTLLVILLLGTGIVISSRWVIIPSLTSELERRGLGITQSIADASRGYILTENTPELTSLIFDAARLAERRPLISYIFILDTQQNVLSHTFTRPFPEELRQANTVPNGQTQSIKLLHIHNDSAYDIAIPVIEGIYRIGTVHVGLSKEHIDRLDTRLTITFISILFAVSLVGFLISQLLSRFISRPILHLTKVSDEISRGNLNIKPDLGSEIRCWEIKDCKEVNCPAYHNAELPCWYIDKTLCAGPPLNKFPEKLDFCKKCNVYNKRVKDEIVQLADSFSSMTHHLKAYEAELRESEEKYRFLFDYDPNSIFVLDAETFEISDVNLRAIEIYGYTKEELIGKSFMDLGPIEFNNGIFSRKDKELSSLYIVYPKIQHWKKDGKPFYVNIYAIKSGHSPKYGIIATTIDITESLSKESQLIQASKLSTLGEMASGVAHELNQPLSALQIGTDFIVNVVKQGQEIPHSELALVSEQMREQIDRAVLIINHLRDFGRKTEIKREKVYINEPIKGVFTILGQQLKLRGIKVVLDLKDDLPPIMADFNRLEQVLINLVVNARDAVEKKNEKLAGEKVENALTVKSFQENGQVVVTVADTGLGIPDEIKDKIFEPFFTAKEVGKGTGLGLSISYGIIKDYDGTIEVESEVGKGTTFKITFPAYEEVRNGAKQ